MNWLIVTLVDVIRMSLPRFGVKDLLYFTALIAIYVVTCRPIVSALTSTSSMKDVVPSLVGFYSGAIGCLVGLEIARYTGWRRLTSPRVRLPALIHWTPVLVSAAIALLLSNVVGMQGAAGALGFSLGFAVFSTLNTGVWVANKGVLQSWGTHTWEMVRVQIDSRGTPESLRIGPKWMPFSVEIPECYQQAVAKMIASNKKIQ